MVVFVGGCSISIKQRSVVEIYILTFDTLSIVIIIGMYDLSVAVDLYTYT